MTRLQFSDLRAPPTLEYDRMPDLLRYWYLGPKARRHMMLRRFSEVDAELCGAAGDRVLDIGSAWGFNVMALNRLGYRATGMDLIIDQFEAGEAVARENDVVFPVIGANATHLPFADEAFDFVTMVETFEHIYLEDRPLVLSECHRVLKPGGRLVFSTPNYYSIVEGIKRLVGRSLWLRKRLPTMCYPEDGTDRGEYHPYRYHRPLPNGSIRDLLEGAGFRVTGVKRFLFTLKNTPDWLFSVVVVGEWLMEKIPGIRRLGASVRFIAKKRG